MHPLLILTAVLALSWFAFAMPASDAGGADDAPAGPPPQIKYLEKYAGTWNAEVEMMGQTSKGVETCRLGVGGAWLITEFEGEFMGAPFAGHGITGFDAMAGKYQGVWVDNSGGPMTTIEDGAVQQDGSLVAIATGLGMDGQPATSRHVTTFDGADRRTFTVNGTGPDGNESVLMRIRYTRRR